MSRHQDESADIARTPRRARSPRGQGDTLRADIVAAAGRLLSRTGDVGELSLRAVAREVGVATTSLYRHFDSLGALILAVRLDYLDEFSAAMTAAAEREDSLDAKLRASARAYVDWGLANPGPYAVLFTKLDLPEELVPSMVAAALASLKGVRQLNAAVVSEEEADLVTTHFWTALHGTVTLRTLRYGYPWPPLDVELDDLVARLTSGVDRRH